MEVQVDFRLVDAYAMISGVLNRTANPINISADCNRTTRMRLGLDRGGVVTRCLDYTFKNPGLES
ncbi:hypothetical protein PL9631_1020068 [Planktothrix paucivesiculata PCC 9631]|uniref:Uncharacterized protein n=1 Tax=Planktothrix paucivesiculata PCC 9631 TaxID=671071 RepID=A0A7Z9BHK4_9CYAN|nr:hypothetical protein PL9631_1020068 [Planktothrix paucivesiculata PCC 9631]